MSRSLAPVVEGWRSCKQGAIKIKGKDPGELNHGKCPTEEFNMEISTETFIVWGVGKRKRRWKLKASHGAAAGCLNSFMGIAAVTDADGRSGD